MEETYHLRGWFELETIKMVIPQGEELGLDHKFVMDNSRQKLVQELDNTGEQ